MTWKIRVQVLCALGLGGIRERHTTGERNWAVGLALTLGFTLGMILIIVTGGVQC